MPTNVSTLTRLFNVAKSRLDAHERFTTEALAAAIRHDPSPLLRALKDKCSLSIESIGDVITEHVIDGGRIDLVARTKPIEIWIEVKRPGVGEHGDQLATYKRHIKKHPKEQLTLVLLASEPLHEPFLHWSDLVRAGEDVARTNPLWSDFFVYLEETMTEVELRADEAISREDEAALRPARRLLAKMARVLEKFIERAKKETWPGITQSSVPTRIETAMGGALVYWGGVGVDLVSGRWASVVAGIRPLKGGACRDRRSTRGSSGTCASIAIATPRRTLASETPSR